jgi:hypothetical protein
VFDDEDGAGFLLSVLCAIALVSLVRKLGERGCFQTTP